ncbi:hypothetical protein Tco_1467924 [Tanacetum coccineum]
MECNSEVGEKIYKRRIRSFETPKQGKSSGETDISPQGLEAAETLAEVLSQIKTKRRNVKTGVRRRLDAEDFSGGNKEEHASLAEIARIQAEEEAENARKEELKRQDELATKRLQEESSCLRKQKAKAQRDKPMTQAQQRQYMATYLKNQGGWKLAQIKKLIDEELIEKFEYLMRSMERFVPIDTEKECRKRTGVELQTESSKKLKSDTREDVSVPKEKDKESVKREEEFKIKKPVLRYTKRKSLARKGLQKKPESAKSGTEEDVEAYMEERVDEPSSEEFPMSSIP